MNHCNTELLLLLQVSLFMDPTVFPRLDPCTFWTPFHHKTLFVKAGFALCERQKIFIDFIFCI